jgi:hypothetical protein
MLQDERLICYGRGTVANGYTGPLGTPACTAASCSASLAPGGTSTIPAGTYVVWVAADAGDLLGTTGALMHQGPTSAAASVTVVANGCIQVSITTDVTGALGYNMFAASVGGASGFYAGRTGYNVGYITAFPHSGPACVAGGGGAGADNSAIATNFDGLLTSTAASGGYVTRLNAALSTTNAGAEFQAAFSALYEAVKADPEEIWMNGFDRQQLSNAIISNSANSAYRIYIPSGAGQGGVSTGAVVQTVMNQTTGKALDVMVHPWFPQGNALVRSKTLPIPDSNVSETSYMAMVQDYVAIQWPVIQMTYDASTFEIGTLVNVAPGWNALIQGIQGVGGVPAKPPSYGDS